MTYKTAVRPSVRPCSVNIFKPYRSDSTGPTSMKLGPYIPWVWIQLLGSGILNFGPHTVWGHPKLSPVVNTRQEKDTAKCRFGCTLNNRERDLSPVSRDDPPCAGCFSYFSITTKGSRHQHLSWSLRLDHKHDRRLTLLSAKSPLSDYTAWSGAVV